MIYKYDGIGEKCPVPLVQMRLLLKKMQFGDQCIITINDTASLNDIPKLLKNLEYNFSEKSLGKGVVEITIKACQ